VPIQAVDEVHPLLVVPHASGLHRGKAVAGSSCLLMFPFDMFQINAVTRAHTLQNASNTACSASAGHPLPGAAASADAAKQLQLRPRLTIFHLV
jgi:xanthine dehydrogenase molybdopterin-binding subunit B